MKEFGGGRFKVVKELGQGAQGLVFLANDTQLDRLVAIKVLHSHSAKSIDEAKIVSRLQHPNIVALYDTLISNGHPCLVFEYVNGRTLAQLLAEEGAMQPVRAVEIICGVLEGLAYAHAEGLIHRDIKPHNVMLDELNRPRLMDFGIAARRGNKEPGEMIGTAGYMAPEMMQNLPVDAEADVFAVGMTLYQMLTGRPAAEGESVYTILHRVANEPFVPPSSLKDSVDEKLDHLVMVALFKNPQERYHDAREMLLALREWQGGQNQQEGGEGSGNSTLDFLLRRMRHTADFPALSQAVTAINKINEGDAERLQVLSEVILQDFSLTNKLLRIVNSASFGHFGGTISTISRAIVILGFDAIRNLAITLLLFEHMHNKAQAITLKDAVLSAFFGGVLSRELGKKSGARDVEEALICGMFTALGKLLTVYYFHEENIEINKRVQAGGNEENASVQVLGLSFRELGMGVAQSWNFPERMLVSMRHLPDGPVKPPQNQTDRLRLFANVGAALVPLIHLPPSAAERGLQEVEKRIRPAYAWSARELGDLLKDSASAYLGYLGILGVDTQQSDFANQLRVLTGVLTNKMNAPQQADTLERAQLHTGQFDSNAETLMPDESIRPAAESLSAGVQDITNTLVTSFKLNDLLRMILETMYRSMGFEHVLIATRDPKKNQIVGRFGFGTDINEIIPRFQIDLDKAVDVFQVALERNADIFIEDINVDSIKTRIPGWYRSALTSQTFIIFPLVLEKRTIGLLYADKTKAGNLKIAGKELNLLKTLRNQALLAIRQKQMGL
ncbi:HDOD domain-containing protein [Iodobacter sp. HSC-16F04]|uniref:HDOD domain-containing protein n=1 Tax=Iodobacter violaceini TaxID=3044271 RepID=A0ABX0KYL5_9NEIS|nr:serine/threonine protein kinase [Iodobacter violacea]NHQ87495.1 HDOD domain-containing protein [Iodobacter violacea]